MSRSAFDRRFETGPVGTVLGYAFLLAVVSYPCSVLTLTLTGLHRLPETPPHATSPAPASASGEERFIPDPEGGRVNIPDCWGPPGDWVAVLALGYAAVLATGCGVLAIRGKRMREARTWIAVVLAVGLSGLFVGLTAGAWRMRGSNEILDLFRRGNLHAVDVFKALRQAATLMILGCLSGAAGAAGAGLLAILRRRAKRRLALTAPEGPRRLGDGPA